MPSFEEEAFTRAQQMHSKIPHYQSTGQPKSEKRQNQTFEKTKASEKKSDCVPPDNKPDENNLINMLFQNKEQSLILLLIVMLMEENSEPTLLLALMYLLI